MSNSNQNDFISGGTLPVGTTITAYGTLSDNSWIRCNGKVITRTAYPRLAAVMSGFAGQMTFTARSLSGTPVLGALAADATNYIAAHNSGTTIQASPDAVTWSTGTGWNGSTTMTCIAKANTRFIACGAAGDFATSPFVSAINQTAANAVVKSNWTATTGYVGVGTHDCNSIAYGLGVAISVSVANSNALNSLADGSTAWVQKTVATKPRAQVVFDGTYFWAITNAASNILTRWDGTNSAEITLPYKYQYTAGKNCIASDGAGTIAMIAGTETISGVIGGSSLVVSKDNGQTWNLIALPPTNNQSANNQSYDDINFALGGNLFKVIAGNNYPKFSRDALSWGEAGCIMPTGGSADGSNFVCKSGIYLTYRDGSSSGYSFTEDYTKLVLPHTYALGNNPNKQDWIKVS